MTDVQPDLFSTASGDALRDDGMAAAAINRALALATARDIALSLGRTQDTVTADDIYKQLDARGIDIKVLGNAAGSIFTGGPWKFTGVWVKSTRNTNHSRYIRAWRLIK